MPDARQSGRDATRPKTGEPPHGFRAIVQSLRVVSIQANGILIPGLAGAQVAPEAKFHVGMGAAIGSELLKTTHHRKRANRNPSRACPEQAHTQLDELCRSLPHTACTRIEVQSPKELSVSSWGIRTCEVSPFGLRN